MMKIGDLHKGHEAAQYPSIETIIADEIQRSRVSYPNAPDDLTALCFTARTLRKNIDERTSERDVYREKLADARAEVERLRDALHTISGHVVLNNENEEELSDSALIALSILAATTQEPPHD